MTGAEIVIKSLEEEGVEVIFGYPGGVLLPIYDALYDSKIRHILVRHEQCAAHAADGYARATGRVGVCLATSGPGATNLVTGIANAYLDSIPMVALTGQVATNMIGTDAFQEADITGITLPIVKHSYLVKDVKDLSLVIKEAFYIASTGRPGPVLIDIPVDVSNARCAYKKLTQFDLAGYKPTIKGHTRQIMQAAKEICHAERPLIIAGGGILRSNAWGELQELVKLTRIPITTTLMGKGAYPETDDLYIGMPGMHGARCANYALTECDLIMAIGMRFDDRVTGKLSTFAPNASVIHIDIDPAEISKNIKAKIPIVGDAKTVLKQLITEIKKVKLKGAKDIGAWQEQINNWKKQYPFTYKKDGKLRPELVVEKTYEITKGEAIIATEVGQNQMWAAQFYKCVKPRSFISSGGLGTMGFGFPASIGAQIGRPNEVVIDIAGDGSIQMVSQELATAVVNKLPINIFILNNGYLGMVRQWQELFYHHRYSQTDLGVGIPDFVKLAEAYGAKGLRVTKANQVESAIKKAINSPETVVVDFLVEREENVFPMVPAGASISEMIGGEIE
ncbi:biosynthetic-type acetolactate synthase large subunit [Candidatus Oleimmundimicrobium sp.]|uniref:biosynthetic-type acetolactate synthase large subunit n=1 Tax=Candidatus Oleimmundimicrobium sp. TaxID=3060597 RepID=UPI002721A3A1|nr:biosynthetic-type acetolactate synthase large subunit [Candidatus Oleimmundimicrobium sp.]MDO8885795.1 biosynthetic-type acetolactate synthase large subunit [Candidatus Oleimmundimicrobium sp.]